MSNFKTWSIRKRHEWLATPQKKKRVKRRAARRVGLLDAWTRQGKGQETVAAPAPEAAAAAEKPAG